MKKGISILTVFILVVFVFTACGQNNNPPGNSNSTENASGTPASSNSGAGEKHLIVAVDPDYESFDPGLAYEVYAHMVLHSCYNNLFEFNEKLENLELAAAEAYEVSADGLSYTFHMRKDIIFSSGNKLNAADVKWSIERSINLKGNGAFMAEDIVSIDTPDEYTVIFRLGNPDPSFPTKLTYNIFCIIDSKVAIEHGATNAANAASTDTAKTWFDSNSAGSGPYCLASYTPKVEVVLTKNSNYWGKEPYYDKITIKTIPDSSTQVMMLQKGDIDIAINVDAEQAKTLANIPEISVKDAQSLTMSFLLMNRDPAVGGPVANPKVQKAIRLALDYVGIQTIAGPGMTTPLAPFPVGLYGSLPARDISNYQDIEAAKALMAEAGYANGFTTDFYVPTTTVSGVELLMMAQKIQNDLKVIGINTNIIPEDVLVSLETYRTGQQSLGLWYWNPDYPDNNSQLAFLPGQKVGLRANWTADMYPELAALADKAAIETDVTERAKIFSTIQNMMAEESAFTCLLQHTSPYAVRASLKGADYISQYTFDFKNISE
ncbi:MAG: ABC transporter substrate-binding protein [Firmicutes bacterium]|nr:ABC transporter substrate-binding protein [Bacillota bacterium]